MMMKQYMQTITAEISAFAKFVSKPKEMSNLPNFMVVALTCVCVVVPLEISQLAFAIVGAVAFSLLQSIQPKTKHRTASSKLPSKFAAPKVQPRLVPSPRPRPQPRSAPQPIPQVAGKEVRKPSAAPVQAPTFNSAEWDTQVVELLNQISPTVEDDKIVAKLAGLVKMAIKPMLPEVEVVGFASGDLMRKKAFGVAVPEVDIVANVSPIVLAERLGLRISPGNSKFDSKKLQKSAIRACTDRLVSIGGFKFRRSAFRGDEPKVTLLAPASFGVCSDAIAIDFSVNVVSPLHNAALLTESGQMEPRARELILLVKRWAKDRGICHAPKGHLPPYAWTLLSVFYLQAGMLDDESLLPSLEGFKTARKLTGLSNGKKAVPSGSQKKTSELFADFVSFYHQVFDWKAEAVSLRQGKRNKPGLSLPLHIIVGEDGQSTTVGPSIEDPFDEAHNLGNGMTHASLERLHEELARAHKLCSSGTASLADLLEPWAPAEQDSEHSSETAEAAKPAANAPAVAPWHKKIAA